MTSATATPRTCPGRVSAQPKSYGGRCTPRLGDDRRDQRRRRDVEGGVAHAATRRARSGGRRRPRPRPGARSSIGIAAPSASPASTVEVGRDDVERHAVVVRQHGQRVRADLVGGVAVRSRCGRRRRPRRRPRPRPNTWATALSVSSVWAMPSSASSKAVSRAPCSSGRVSRHPHVRPRAALGEGLDDAERRAVAARRQPAGVALRDQLRRVAEQRRPVRAHLPAALDLVVVDAAGDAPPARRAARRRRATAPSSTARASPHAPGQVDRRRPRDRQRVGRRGDLAAQRARARRARARPPARRPSRRRRRAPARRGSRAPGWPPRARPPWRTGARRARQAAGSGRGGRPRRPPA